MLSATAWAAIGFLGQAFFASRFIVQWIVSERRRESVVPMYFWYASLVGGAILLIYAIYRRDPVFIVGQGSGIVVYLRNIALVRRRAVAGS
jgi:lipid-A-disaccharide synthase-like uncharacterized protein